MTLEIDPQYLYMGKVVVNQASGVLPDGTLFEIAAPLVMEIPANSASQALYLALPMLAGHAVEVRHPAQTDVLARYSSYEVEVGDANAGKTRAAPSPAHARIFAWCWAMITTSRPTSDSKSHKSWIATPKALCSSIAHSPRRSCTCMIRHFAVVPQGGGQPVGVSR